MSAVKESVNWDFMFDPPELHEIQHQDCQECHAYHRKESGFDSECLRCKEEVCSYCKGEVYIMTSHGEYECQKCDATGWKIN